MADKVYCEDCKSLRSIPSVCGITEKDTAKYVCKHKNNIYYGDAWLRKKPIELRFTTLPVIRNYKNNCGDFEPKE